MVFLFENCVRLAKRFVAQSKLSKETLPWQELAQALLLFNEFMFVGLNTFRKLRVDIGTHCFICYVWA